MSELSSPQNLEEVCAYLELCVEEAKDKAWGEGISFALCFIKKLLPSAQPEIAKDINVPSNDCISRQAAIDIVVFECGKWTGLAKEISNQLKRLPPAQPEPCEELDFVQEHKKIPVVLDIQQKGKSTPSAQPEIIHCRDCKHKPSGDGVNHNITFPDGVCPCQCDDYWYSWIPNDDWYCGNAERGEE